MEKDFKWINGFSNGVLKMAKAFAAAFDHPGNDYTFKIKECFDLIKLTSEDLQKLFPDAIIVKNTMKYKDDFIEDDERDEHISFTIWDNIGAMTPKDQDYYIFDFTNKMFIFIGSYYINVKYIDSDPEEAINKLLTVLRLEEDKAEAAEIQLVAYNQEYYTITSEVNKLHIDIDKNYNNDFKPIYNDLVNFLNQKNSGLVLLSGIPGSGKTSLIRHLLTSYPKHYIYVTGAIAQHLGSPEFTSFMLDNANSIFILEDCEDLLAKRGSGFNFNNALADILNMTDGLMSDILNIKFICTFNTDITNIDEALLRKGRCYANYKFGKLCAEKSKALLKEQGIEVEDCKEMSLTEIYNYGDSDYSKVKTNKLGF